jgi:lipopolysaccharide/colanic/teichoic acid biosynthesis glycosyltransferase
MSTFTTECFQHRKPSGLAVVLKRFIDFALAFVLLVSLAPLMLFLIVLIYLDSPGPIFYTSERIGKNGCAFPCFKLRTMVKDAESLKAQFEALNERDSILFKVSGDPRVTHFGGFLRKYSLDELPQLLNVLRGEMSMVGPRPPLAAEVEMYQPEHLVRLSVLPGITGLWQVESRRNPSFANYIALDRRYVENWSLWLDLKILVRTTGVVLRGTGS